MSVKTYQLSFHVFICVSHQEISSFFFLVRDSPFYSYFVLQQVSLDLSHVLRYIGDI